MDCNRKKLKPTYLKVILTLFLLFTTVSNLSANPSSLILGDMGTDALTQVTAGTQGIVADINGLPTVSDFGIGQPPEDANGKVSMSKDSIGMTLTVLVGVLLLIVLILVFILANLINLVRVREGEEALDFKGTMALMLRLMKNRWVILIGNGVIGLLALLWWIDFARTQVGIHQNYMPEQPIYFSHEIHAGNYEIDCQYCHTGAGIGKNAWVPSVNVCMNCHKAIQGIDAGGDYSAAEAEFYTGEIAKVRQHYEEGKPIEWVRVHNLPDHAYFNHSQHVVVGKVECQTCHGPVEEMGEVYQFAQLDMGWCINCHRDTQVDQNLYEEIMPDWEVETVEDIGGTNCARCHY